ncbi:hypothetical protein [Paenibacillus sp. UNC499MF]|uniref:hypothetical protein n=1 Tax=Paenibacillus sp. UNC499MF TaxID=1502751 RepID=UPI00089FCE10|nr:hypothetical protein [Paenibacillus sp. UNC499MF]SEG56521.1 hypothetical protein SAMN02799616_03543 [Paenibacillus sp. UNC499MF]
MRVKKWVLGFITAALLSLTLMISGAAAAQVTSVHSVWSTKPIQVIDNGTVYKAKAGNVIVSWTNQPLSSGDSGFFNAIVQANGSQYEFRLVSFSSSTNDEITGKFDIYKNNILVTTVAGTAYGLSQPVGSYFKFYDTSQQWHVSAYITSRFDY